jgi:hypothetical protein
VSGPIQTLPLGLLGLLQLKSGGSNPSQLADTVSPTYDLGKFYENNQSLLCATLFGGTPALTTNARGAPVFQVGGVNITVPQKELWYVQEWTISCNLLAAEYIRFAPWFTGPGALSNLQMGPDYNDVVTARVRFASARIDRPFFAHAGCFFGCFVYDIITAGTITVSMEMRAVRMSL